HPCSSITLPPPSSTLFPYTTLFRSSAFTRYALPGPNRVLLQTILANLTRHAATMVNARNGTRAPLLLVAGGKDRFVLPSLVKARSEEHTSELQSLAYLVCRLLLEKK